MNSEPIQLKEGDTICAPATSTGGAIGIVRISGPGAIAIADRIFSADLAGAPGYSVHYGQLTDIDDALATVFRAPHSYTGEDSVELSCHGSQYILEQVCRLLCEQGCRMANPGEFTQRAFLNGKMDLAQAEAVADIIASRTSAQHRMAMSQLRGGFSRELAALRDQLLHLTTLLELELDFSDHEELEFADRTQLLTLAQQIDQTITSLADSFRQGNAIKHGIPVAIVGAPNVGKSTLLNALLKEDKAIVSDIPGTTRDYIEGLFTIRGHLFRFIDTAGLRQTDDTIERLGIERSHKAIQEAHIVIMMNEPGVPFPELDIRPDQTVIKITNKTEQFQAIHGIGLAALEEQLVAAIPQQQEDSIVVTNARHHAALCNAREALGHVIEGLRTAIPTDLLAEDLRATIDHLGEITGGTITSQEVLNNIWKNFCIGK